MSSETPALVIFRGGFSADVAVVRCLLELEAKGARFELLPDDRVRVLPAGLLDAEARAFLQSQRIEAVRVLRYMADDSHLFDDKSRAQSPADGPRERTA